MAMKFFRMRRQLGSHGNVQLLEYFSPDADVAAVHWRDQHQLYRESLTTNNIEWERMLVKPDQAAILGVECPQSANDLRRPTGTRSRWLGSDPTSCPLVPSSKMLCS